MTRVLITAFDRYDCWEDNSSWLALVALTQNLPESPTVTTRRYTVAYDAVQRNLVRDLRAGYDVAIHLGQAPGSTSVRLESFALNARGETSSTEACVPLSDKGPLAFQTVFPLDAIAQKMRGAGVPAQVSYHAGTYLCNATLYWSHLYAATFQVPTRSVFVHLPLDPRQVITMADPPPTLPAAISAEAVRLLLNEVTHWIEADKEASA